MSMIKAIRAAILAAIPALCAGMQAAPTQEPQTKPASEQQAVPTAPATAAAEAAATKPTAPPAVPVDEKVFVIGPEDQIEVTVWADNRIGGPLLVRPDGRISMNLLGEVQASGRTPAELGTDIEELLKKKDILRRPQVNVKILQVHSKKYRINGEVMKTGAFPLVVPTRVMDALVEAGGFKDFANKKDIVIMRGTERLKFNWNDAVRGKKPEQNVYLQHGDIIIVK
jgi:polysaccharide export outer membrane protein